MNQQIRKLHHPGTHITTKKKTPEDLARDLGVAAIRVLEAADTWEKLRAAWTPARGQGEARAEKFLAQCVRDWRAARAALAQVGAP